VTLLHDFPAPTLLPAAPVMLLLLVAAAKVLPLLLTPATVAPVAVVTAGPLVLPTFILPVCGI